MGDSKKKSGPKPGGSIPQGEAPRAAAGRGELGLEPLDRLSALQLVDLIAARIPSEQASWVELLHLRNRVATLEETNYQAQEALQQMDGVIEKLRAPALRVGTLIAAIEPDKAHVSLAGGDYVCRVDPSLDPASLQIGQRVLCNEAFNIVQGMGFDRGGPIVRVDDMLSDGRLRVAQEGGLGPVVVPRSSLLSKEKLRSGMEVRLDPAQRVALEVVGAGKRVDRSLETVTELPWEAIGGQDEAVRSIRETIELPFLHAGLFQRFEYSVPKGFLLHGPPGCGKTLLGKATAHNLRRQIRERSGVDHPEFFLHVKGPEILNMWVGESERQVRDLFAQCREKAAEGALAFLFIDEADALLGTRRSGRHSGMSATLVPMFCTEMDGLNPLKNVVVILASNRADMIDPAILRPGRIDRKIRVRRPDEEGARRIYEIYLHERLPLAEPGPVLAAAVSAAHFERGAANQFLEVTHRSGRREILHKGDLASGAVIAAVVERAKNLAIKRSIQEGGESPITRGDLLTALRHEYEENELFPSSDATEDWLRLTDFDPENVVRLGPVRPRNFPPPGMV